MNFYFVSVEWIYTALTRATDLSNIQIFTGVLPNPKDLDKIINNKLNLHQIEDELKEREFDLDSQWVHSQLKNVKSCKYCHCDLDITGDHQFSVDRVDSRRGHTKDNCQIICLRCNVSKKDL